MPIYTFSCDEHGRFEALYLRSTDCTGTHPCPSCSARAGKVPSIPAPPDFNTPVYRQLEATGRIVKEPGLDRDAAAAKKQRLERIDKAYTQTAAEVVREMTDGDRINLTA